MHAGYYMCHPFLVLNFSIFPVKYIYTFRIIFHKMHLGGWHSSYNETQRDALFLIFI
jgi:hypothetical protein